ncbi:MAG: 16S rRNA (guanine(966)-N(2))-methyltransferase RsmD [Halothiobacillaceae bacterium]
MNRRAGPGRNCLRIIGGTHRRRSLRFPDRPGLRPTPDRVRETLFNWLAGRVRGAHCLDLFAGSGALGLEALSRGAASCWFVERDRHAAEALSDNLALFGLGSDRLLRMDSRRALELAPWSEQEPVDLVFVDPPFAVAGLDDAVLERLDCADWLASDAAIYLEHSAARGRPRIPAGWAVHRSGHAGESAYLLLLRNPAGSPLTGESPAASQ